MDQDTNEPQVHCTGKKPIEFNALISLPSSKRIFTDELRSGFMVDTVWVSIFSSSLHPGLYKGKDQLWARVQALVADGNSTYTTEPFKGKLWVTHRANHLTTRHSTSSTYAMLGETSVIRCLRKVLQEAGCLTEFYPGATEPGGNHISPSHLVDFPWESMGEYCQNETAKAIQAFRDQFKMNAQVIFDRSIISLVTSLTRADIAWDIPSSNPKGMVDSFQRAIDVNFIHGKNGWRGTKQFSFQCYTKRNATDGNQGLVRFEFQFHKEGIKKILGSVTLPYTENPIRARFTKLAEHSWPFLVELDNDRLRIPVQIVPDPLFSLLSSRRRRHVEEIMNTLILDGRIRVTGRNRGLLGVMEAAGWVKKLLFSRPAFRKLVADLGLWEGQITT